VAMTDHDRSALQELADLAFGWAPSINAARAALIEIEELRKKSELFQRNNADLTAEIDKQQKKSRDDAAIIVRQASDMYEWDVRNEALTKEAKELREQSNRWEKAYADAMTENSHLKCRLDTSFSQEDYEDSRERLRNLHAVIEARNATIARLKEKLAAPPETAAIAEIHNRLAKLENNAVNDRVFLGSVRVDVSDLERDVKFIGDEVITIQENKVIKFLMAD
jgi:septal ring factor EnvC (AmiA/AmiB activator)